MEKIVFADVKERLVELLKSMASEGILADIKEDLILVDGFENGPLLEELVDDTIAGGVRIPRVILVGGKSGRIYQFALKALLPDLGISKDTDAGSL